MDWLKLAKDNASRENLSGVHNQVRYILKYKVTFFNVNNFYRAIIR